MTVFDGTGRLSPLLTWRASIASKDSQLPSTTRHVALTLSLHMAEKGDSCYPGTALLADETGLSELTVRNHLQILADRGWLTIKRPPHQGRGQYTQYIVTTPKRGQEVTPLEPEKRGYEVTPSEKKGLPDEGKGVTSPRSADPLPIFTEEIKQESSAARARPRRTTTGIPPDWTPSPALLSWAAKETPTVNPLDEVAQFRDHHLATANAGGIRDWDAAFRKWMRNAVTFAARDAARHVGNGNSKPSTPYERTQAAIAKVREEWGIQP